MTEALKYHVYLIRSCVDSNRYYKGYTTDLSKRLQAHNLGKVRSTSASLLSRCHNSRILLPEYDIPHPHTRGRSWNCHRILSPARRIAPVPAWPSCFFESTGNSRFYWSSLIRQFFNNIAPAQGSARWTNHLPWLQISSSGKPGNYRLSFTW